jgi:hypothetical protein
MTSSLTTEATQTSQTTPAAVRAQGPTKDATTDNGLSFSDLLGVINPLQHIPVVGTLYRELTGDTISPAAQIAGDALYGGLIGLGSSIVNEVVQSTTGNDIGGHIWATLFGDSDEATPVQVADTTPAPQMINSAEAPVTGQGTTPLNGPTSFFQGLQQGAHRSRGVPLSATVPTGNNPQPIRPASTGTVDGANALLQAQGPNGALSTQASQAAAMGTTGLGASLSTPPPAIGAAPPLSGAAAAPAPAVPGNVADKMMQALDAYKAMALQQDMKDKPVAPDGSSLVTGPAANAGVSPTALIN